MKTSVLIININFLSLFTFDLLVHCGADLELCLIQSVIGQEVIYDLHVYKATKHILKPTTFIFESQ